MSSHMNESITLAHVLKRYRYCRFYVPFRHTVPKFVANLPITLSSSEVGRELRNEVPAQLPNLET
jgi:hypothetical protein